MATAIHGWPYPVFMRQVVHEARITRNVNTAATTLLLYDFVLTFEDEVVRIWKDGEWSGAKALWFCHRYINLINFAVIPLILDMGVSCDQYSWFPFLQTIVCQLFVAAILSFRCWALFGGSRVILSLLAVIYVACLGLQIYPAVIAFRRRYEAVPGLAEYRDRYTACFIGSYLAVLEKRLAPWRIAGWIGNVIFDGLVTLLTAVRAIRLRVCHVRITLAEIMFRDGVFYFATVCALNIAVIVTFLTLDCALQLLFLRLTQVFTVVMISHMFLNLKGSGGRTPVRTCGGSSCTAGMETTDDDRRKAPFSWPFRSGGGMGGITTTGSSSYGGSSSKDREADVRPSETVVEFHLEPISLLRPVPSSVWGDDDRKTIEGGFRQQPQPQPQALPPSLPLSPRWADEQIGDSDCVRLDRPSTPPRLQPPPVPSSLSLSPPPSPVPVPAPRLSTSLFSPS